MGKKEIAFSKAIDVESEIAKLHAEQAWNHNIVLPNSIETSPGKQSSHGKNNVKWERIEPIIDLLEISNKKVLDLGCNEGFFSKKLADKGANVLGIDIDSLRIKKAKFVQSVLGFNNPNFKILDIYSEEFQNLDNFDVCLCMGFIHRIPDPYTAIAAIGSKTNTIVFEWKTLKQGPHDEAFAFFSQKGIDHEDYYGTEYWLLTYSAVESVLKRLDFKYFYRVDDPRQRRAILVASKNKNKLSDRKNIVLHRGRLITFLSHTKRYLKSIIKIINGQLNS